MKFTKIFSMAALLSVLLSTNVFAKELTSGSLSVHYNVLEGAFKIYNKAVFKGNGTPEGDAFAKKCNNLEQKRIDKHIEYEKYIMNTPELNKMSEAQKKKSKSLFQERRTLSEKMVKEGCFRR